MRFLRQCQCGLISAGPEAPVRRLADLMDLHTVGCVVVVDESGAPLGTVTDRDLVRRVLAPGRDPEKTTAQEVMSTDPLTVDAGLPLARALERMRERGVRRVLVVEGGRLTGIASLDDVLMALSADVWNLAEAVRIELRDSQRSVSRRRWREQRGEALDLLGSQARDLVRGFRRFAGDELAHLLGGLRASR